MRTWRVTHLAYLRRHYHTSLNCAMAAKTSAAITWLSLSISAGHSMLAGVMLDGRGLYGPYETAGTAPVNLDACNGHVGPVPAYSQTINGVLVAFPSSSAVYHYHVTSYAPFTVGCFGPVASVAAAKALYPACAAGGVACAASSQVTAGCAEGQTWTACTSQGQLTGYALGCPIFQGYNVETSKMETNANQFPSPTTDCPACSGTFRCLL